MLDYFPVRSVHFSQPRNGAFMLRHVFLIWAKLNIWVALWVYRAFRVWFVFFFSFRFFCFFLLLLRRCCCTIIATVLCFVIFEVHQKRYSQYMRLYCDALFGLASIQNVLFWGLSHLAVYTLRHTQAHIFERKMKKKKNERQVHPLSSWSNNNVNKTTWRQRPRQPNVYYK